MNKLVHIVILNFVFFVGCVGERGELKATPKEAWNLSISAELRKDLALLRQQDQHNFNASPAIMAAARRVFSEIKFEGLTKEQLKELLGQPMEIVQRNGKTAWDYMYHNGEQGIHRRLWFDADETRVVRVEVIPTQ